MPISDTIFDELPARDYLDLRGEIKNGDILLCSGRGFMSELIKFGTHCPWAHVGFIFRLDDIDRLMILEAVTTGIRTIALSAFISGTEMMRPYTGRLLVARHAEFERLANPANLRKMSQFAVDRFGIPYAGWEIAKIAARIALGKLGVDLPGYLVPRGEYICSEYAARCYGALGIEIPWGSLGFIAPADFALAKDINAVGVLRTVG